MQHLKKRHIQDALFRSVSFFAIMIAVLILLALLTTIIGQARGALTYHHLTLPLSSKTDDESSYKSQIFESLKQQLPDDLTTSAQFKKIKKIISSRSLRSAKSNEKSDMVTLMLSDTADQYLKGSILKDIPESDRKISDPEIQALDWLMEHGHIEKRWNVGFFENADSSDPELAGILGALIGSCFTMLVTLVFSFPLGVASAIYLEEFAGKRRWQQWVEININNLAAVPSVIFGLLGLAIFIQWFGLPRSSPLVGGMVLALMTLPTIIIATRVALRSVPNSIRQAALALGASQVQMVFHQVLPLALPGILTGTIIGMSRALGETAPLLLIGMVAFIADLPSGFTDTATVLPVQIFLWADKPERGFAEKTMAAILVLLIFLILMNALAIYLRKKFERKWN